jgi:hypothetical protein
VDGARYEVRDTYFSASRYGGSELVIEYLCGERCPDFDRLEDIDAGALAFPLMKHAVTAELYRRELPGQPSQQTGTVVVAITRRGSVVERSYRVARDVPSIIATMRTGGPARPQCNPWQAVEAEEG